ncbi:hemerythrin domain-containing protein [Candidatus Nitrospira bockiana]
MRTITQFMQDDHDRLDRLLTEATAAASTDLTRAMGAFTGFRQGLERHIVWEEDLLFPVFDRESGMEGQGPTAVMRLEHRRIKEGLDQIHDRLREGKAFDLLARQLVDTLAAHNQKEERILYPWIDRLLASADAEALMQRMAQMPEEQGRRCCEPSSAGTARGGSA